jgi:hypothetical protein
MKELVAAIPTVTTRNNEWPTTIANEIDPPSLMREEWPSAKGRET